MMKITSICLDYVQVVLSARRRNGAQLLNSVLLPLHLRAANVTSQMESGLRRLKLYFYYQVHNLS